MPTLPLQHRVQLVTAPVRQPINIFECKDQMRIEHSDDDIIINRFIDTATRFVDVTGALGKAMITQTWGEWIAPNPSVVYLSLGPVQSVSAIKYYDTNNALQTDTLSNYHVLGTSGRMLVSPKTGFSWPITFQRDDAIKIEYVIGYGDAPTDVPETIRHALFMLVAHYYENREPELVGTISKTLPYGFEDLIGIERSSYYG